MIALVRRVQTVRRTAQCTVQTYGEQYADAATINAECNARKLLTLNSSVTVRALSFSSCIKDNESTTALSSVIHDGVNYKI